LPGLGAAIGQRHLVPCFWRFPAAGDDFGFDGVEMQRRPARAADRPNHQAFGEDDAFCTSAGLIRGLTWCERRNQEENEGQRREKPAADSIHVAEPWKARFGLRERIAAPYPAVEENPCLPAGVSLRSWRFCAQLLLRAKTPRAQRKN